MTLRAAASSGRMSGSRCLARAQPHGGPARARRGRARGRRAAAGRWRRRRARRTPRRRRGRRRSGPAGRGAACAGRLGRLRRGAAPVAAAAHQQGGQLDAAVGRADLPALAGGVAVGGAGEQLAVELAEALDRRRPERAELRVHVRRAGLDLAVLGGREQVQVLAHEALVVGAAADEVGRDADDVPVGGDLLRVGGVQPQRAAAHLLDGDAGGGDRHVDQDVQRRAVPALAEQRARADEAASWCPRSNSRVASSTHARGIHSAPPDCSETSRPSTSASHSASLKWSSAVGAAAPRAGPRRRRAAAQAAAGDQQRAHVARCGRRRRSPAARGGRCRRRGRARR